MIPYIVYAALITAVCFLFYRLLLHRETFFHLNRWFFLGCLLSSFLLPLLPVPGGWSLRFLVADIRREPAAVIDEPASSAGAPTALRGEPAIVTGKPAALRGKPASSASESTAVNEPSLIGALLSTDNTGIASAGIPDRAAARENSSISASQFSLTRLLKWLSYAYLCGILIFGFNLLLQLLVLFFRTRAHSLIRDGAYRIVETTGNRAPCSFGRYIFINPSLYDEETFTQILTHEKIHVQQGHSIDIMLAELCIVIQWFNPFAWWYRKALEDNLEFLTDAAVIRDPRTDASHYQMSLLRVSAPYLPLSITSNYNQSLLKKRIIMMHIQKSSLRTTWKYLFLLPLLTGMVCIFNDTNAASATSGAVSDAQVASPASSAAQAASPALSAERTPSPTALADTSVPADITVHAGPDVTVRANADVSVRASADVNVNPDVNVHVNPDVNVHVNPDVNVNVNATGLRQFNWNWQDSRSGSWTATINGDEVQLSLKSENGESTSNSSFKKSEFSSLPTGQKSEFTLTRDAGTLHLTGGFEGNDGSGQYTFKENPDFVAFLEKEGVTDVKEGQMMGAFFTNVRKDYVESLVRAGYTQLAFHELIALSAMKVDIAYIQSWKELGYPDLPIHELIALKSMGVDATYLKELKDAGFDHPAPHDLIALKSMGITSAYVAEVRQMGDKNPQTHDVIAFKSLGIDGKFVHSFEQIGYTHLEPHELMAFKSLGITPDFVKGFSNIGFKDIPAHTLEELKSMGITSDYITAMKSKGFDSKDLQEYVKLKTFR